MTIENYLTFSPPRMSKWRSLRANGPEVEYCKLTRLAWREADEGQVSGGLWSGLDSRSASIGRRVYWSTRSTEIIWAVREYTENKRGHEKMSERYKIKIINLRAKNQYRGFIQRLILVPGAKLCIKLAAVLKKYD